MFLAACDPGADSLPVVEFQGVTMGTSYTVKLVEYSGNLPRAEIQSRVDSLLDGINRHMSTYLPDSELSLFNASRDTGWVDASAELVEVLQAAQGISEATGGAFDVTVGPLVELWGFGPTLGRDEVPAEDLIDKARGRVGYDALQVRSTPPAIRKQNPDLYVDLSAIAKGYAVDRVANLLETLGSEDYMVEIGGEIRARGHNPKGHAWKIAVEKPVSGARIVQTILNLDGSGLATSGDYRNYFEKNGRRYSHTIDPHTGYPISHRLASVSVIDPSAMRADALATALMVLGPEAGYAFAEQHAVAALFIVKGNKDFETRSSSALAAYVAAHRE